jgi:5'(3')-deoxyribonucleotidase
MIKENTTTTPRLGIDFGNTIIRVLTSTDDQQHLKQQEFPGAASTIQELAKHCFGKELYVISKVNPGGKEKVLEWMRDHNFHHRFGIPPEQILFCAERREKGPIAARLGLTHFIDDRPEVMIHMQSVRRRILFNPDSTDYDFFKDRLTGVERATDWNEIKRLLLPS